MFAEKPTDPRCGRSYQLAARSQRARRNQHVRWLVPQRESLQHRSSWWPKKHEIIGNFISLLPNPTSPPRARTCFISLCAASSVLPQPLPRSLHCCSPRRTRAAPASDQPAATFPPRLRGKLNAARIICVKGRATSKVTAPSRSTVFPQAMLLRGLVSRAT